MAAVAYGVALPFEGPVGELLDVACEAEELGYDVLWGNDDRLQKDVYAVLSAIALRTGRIRLGPGVTNPYSRHPALTATAIATLDELSGGRAVLGLGAGGTNHRMLGVQREAPVVAVREAIEVIRALVAGSVITLEGRIVTTYEARLDFDPIRPAVPIFIGARGPKVLELAGEIADGVIVGNVAALEGWRYAVGRIAAGALRAGRDPGELELTAWLYCCISDDGAVARDAIRPMVATSLVTSRAILDDLGLVLPEQFVRVMEELSWSLAWSAVARAGAVLPDEILEFFGLAGTPAQCREKLARLLEAFPQISQVTIVPFPTPEQRAGDVVRRFIREVALNASSDVPGHLEEGRRSAGYR